MAEIEINIFERGCLSKRVKSFDHLWQYIVTVATEHNTQHCRIHLRLTYADARAQMHDLYPSLKFKLDGLLAQSVNQSRDDCVFLTSTHKSVK